MHNFTRYIKRAVSVVFRRETVTGALLLLQLVGFPLLLYTVAEYARWISVGCVVVSVLMCLALVRQDSMTPEFKLSWILVFAVMPVPGGILFLLWGNKRPAFRMRRHLEREDGRLRPLLRQAPAPMETLRRLDARSAQTAAYLRDYGPYPVFDNTQVKYYPQGEDLYADLLPALESAEHFIFIEFFIIGLGEMWEGIHEILRRKAIAGVDVRVIYDDVGSVKVLPMSYWKRLESEGIHCMPFNPFVPVLNLVMNNRDHRKILVVDGVTAFSGGINLADEYINRLPRFGHWKDTGIRLQGDAVWSFSLMFLEFWNATRPTDTNFDRFRPPAGSAPGSSLVQPFADSPVDREAVARSVYLELISQARETLFITTPYLILDDDVKTALCLAAKRGVNVRLYTPGIPDKPMTYQLTRSYFPPLIDAGVHIFSYTPGFVHAKTWLVDGRIGAVGSINLDYRSLFLHFECSTLLYGGTVLQDIGRDLAALEQQSRELSLADCRTGFFGTMLSGVLRILAPLF